MVVAATHAKVPSARAVQLQWWRHQQRELCIYTQSALYDVTGAVSLGFVFFFGGVAIPTTVALQLHRWRDAFRGKVQCATGSGRAMSRARFASFLP